MIRNLFILQILCPLPPAKLVRGLARLPSLPRAPGSPRSGWAAASAAVRPLLLAVCRVTHTFHRRLSRARPRLSVKAQGPRTVWWWHRPALGVLVASVRPRTGSATRRCVLPF